MFVDDEMELARLRRDRLRSHIYVTLVGLIACTLTLFAVVPDALARNANMAPAAITAPVRSTEASNALHAGEFGIVRAQAPRISHAR